MKDLSGLRFGKLLVLKRVESIVGTTGHNIQRWLCRCDCGNECIVRHGNLTSGNSTSCGCYKAEKISERKFIDIRGQRFGNLIPIARAEHWDKKKTFYLCLCDCGHIAIISRGNLISGNTTTCGCGKNSFGESIIINHLHLRNVSYRKEVSFPDLCSHLGNPLRFDFAIYSDKKILFLLEYQGEQHFNASHGTFGKYEREYSDKAKKVYCAEHDICLEEIAYNENIRQSLDKILIKHQLLHDNAVPSQSNLEGVTTIS